VHRCGVHAILANPGSPVRIWIECPVHRGTAQQVGERFGDMMRLEFFGEEILQLEWIVQHAMLD
jgi:hypothetical protein